MTCEDTQKSFSSYLDDQLTHASRAAMDAHLAECPVCRCHLHETRVLTRQLASLERPAPPFDLAATISDALLIERAARSQQPSPFLHVRLLTWLRPRLMPYTVGALASVLLFMAVSTALRPQFRVLHELVVAARADAYIPSQVIWVDGAGFDVTQPVSVQMLANSRVPYGAESPSLNPRGALAALVRSPSRGRDGDDDMAIVADVFSNDSASLAAVVQPPRNPRLLDEVREALRETPAFVPASLDQRPQTMRVVFSLSRVNVHERSF